MTLAGHRALWNRTAEHQYQLFTICFSDGGGRGQGREKLSFVCILEAVKLAKMYTGEVGNWVHSTWEIAFKATSKEKEEHTLM
jgi:hypothetical protein